MTAAFIRLTAIALCVSQVPQAFAQNTSTPLELKQLTQSAPKDSPSNPEYWGAIAFTADGSFATSWKKESKAEAETDVAVRCAKFGRGGCETGSFSGEICVGLATFIGSHSGRRWKLSFTGGADSSAAAQQKALDRCNADQPSRGRCQLRTVACADGR
jgi:hypothetical protein